MTIFKEQRSIHDDIQGTEINTRPYSRNRDQYMTIFKFYHRKFHSEITIITAVSFIFCDKYFRNPFAAVDL